jgi:NTE family protein
VDNIVSDNLPLAQKDNVIQPRKNLNQRALILSGGGALGAYQVGVLKILCKTLSQQDKGKGDNDRLLFDIIAGTSIGAMNGAVLVSQYLKTGNWQDAIDQLEQFWIDKEKGLASTVSEQDLMESKGWKKWHQESQKNNPSSDVASAEAARRYYSVRHYISKGTPRVQNPLPYRADSRFFDDQPNTWFVHSSDPLRETILHFAECPIATSSEENQPRLLVFAVDIAEGETVTFDSYAKADGSRKSEYGNYTEEKGYEHVIKYDKGVDIDQIMASGTLPEFYDYKVIDGHKFWDGGLLSNTPLREVLHAHQEYLANVMSKTNAINDNFIPDLEVYIVNKTTTVLSN